MIQGSGQVSRSSWSCPHDCSCVSICPHTTVFTGRRQRLALTGHSCLHAFSLADFPYVVFPELELVPRSGSLVPEHIDMCLIPAFSGPARGAGTLAMIGEPTLTHHNHPKFPVHSRVLSWWCQSMGVNKHMMPCTPPSRVAAPRILWALRIHVFLPGLEFNFHFMPPLGNFYHMHVLVL